MKSLNTNTQNNIERKYKKTTFETCLFIFLLPSLAPPAAMAGWGGYDVHRLLVAGVETPQLPVTNNSQVVQLLTILVYMEVLKCRRCILTWNTWRKEQIQGKHRSLAKGLVIIKGKNIKCISCDCPINAFFLCQLIPDDAFWWEENTSSKW
jgi:hypothetical protein